MKKEWMRPVSYLLVAIVLFFSFNVFGHLTFGRFNIDLTQERVFTLSDGTKDIIKNLDEPIVLRFYFSNKTANGLPQVKSFADRIRSLMEEYVSYSDGMIRLQMIDPEPFSEEEDIAIAYGLKGAPIDELGNKIYLGLAATNSVDKTHAIPIFTFEREAFLEYELSRIIHDLSHPKRPTIGILSSRNMFPPSLMGIPGLATGKGWVIVDQINELFKIEPIDSGATTIPQGVDVLMVVQPKNMSPAQLYAIDQFVLKGGAAVFFLDPNQEEDNGFSPKEAKFDVSIAKLLNSWGVRLDSHHVIADRNAARRVKNDKDGQGFVDYVAWLDLRDDNINKDDIVMAPLSSLAMATPGHITPLENSTLEFTPLVKTSKRSMKLVASNLQGAPKPNELLAGFASDDKEYVLAARIRGIAKTAFPEDKSDGHMGTSEGPINVVLVADSDLLRDNFWLRSQELNGYRIVIPTADNGPFVMNVLDHLSGGESLISLRSRGKVSRPFTVVEDIKRNAEERFLSKEKELQEKLEITEAQLAQLKSQEEQAGDNFLFKERQRYEIKRFSDEAMRIRKELRAVQGELRKDIESLGTKLKFINILLSPLLVILIAGLFLIYRSRKSS